MRPVLCLIPLMLLLLVAAPAVQAKGALYFEKVLVGDESSDFPKGALDIENVYVSELYAYDADLGTTSDRVILRIEPRSLNDMGSCQVQTSAESFAVVCQLRYDVNFTANGQRHHLWAVLDPPKRSHCCLPAAANTAVFADGTSVRMVLERPDLGLPPGTRIEQLYVTSALIVQGRGQAGDRAPGDNENRPYDQRPDLEQVFAPVYTLEGTYEFFEVEVVDGTHRDSVGGAAVEYDLYVMPTSNVIDDTIRFRFDLPEGWSVTPSRGTTGINPRGLITGLSEGMRGEMSLQVSANNVVDTGQTYTVVTHIHSATQGYKVVPLTVRVTGPTIEDPDYVFKWHEAPELRAGRDGEFRFEVLDPSGAPRTQLPIEVVFSKDGRRVSSVPAVADGGGYRVRYEFPSSGTWTLDARVLGMEPSPHGTVTVNVEPKTTPAGGPLLFCIALAAALLVKARLPSRP